MEPDIKKRFISIILWAGRHVGCLPIDRILERSCSKMNFCAKTRAPDFSNLTVIKLVYQNLIYKELLLLSQEVEFCSVSL